MPASITICPQCGGVVDAPFGASLAGKTRCTCVRHQSKAKSAAAASGGATATISAPPVLGIGSRAATEYASQLTGTGKQKFCCVCGKEVTHDRRMKDAVSGRYWCTECGAAQPQHVQHAMDMPCPECHRRVAAVRLVRYQERYICPACYTCYTRHNQRGLAGGRLPVLFVLGLVLTGVILYGLFVLGLH